MSIRKATEADLPYIDIIYGDVHTAQEKGKLITGWDRDIYPIRSTAEESIARDDLFVQEDNGKIVGTGIINHVQADMYKGAEWKYDESDDEIMVIHTLVISPKVARKGYGKEFLDFYQKYAREKGCKALRLDTNERNLNARAFYEKLGYEQVGIVGCDFHGLQNIRLVLFEKKL